MRHRAQFTPQFVMRLAVASLALLVVVAPSAAAARPLPFPVPDSGAFIGAYVPGGTASDLDAFTTSAGKQHAFFGKFLAVGSQEYDAGGASSAAAFAAACHDRHAAPMFTLEPWGAKSGAVLSDADRAWLTRFAKGLGAQRIPAFIRFGHEMNGDWYPWGWNHVAPADYIAAFREVSTIFRTYAPEAAIVWAPSQNWGSTTDELYSTWYPGDEWVDWVGLTTYQWPYSGLSETQFLGSIIWGKGAEGDFYQTFAVGHAKPMMVPETACGDDLPAYYDNWCYGSLKDETGTYGTAPGLGAQQWWIRQVYSTDAGWSSTRTRLPQLKAIAWFDKEDVGKSWADFQIGGSDPTSHSAGFEAYSAAIAPDYWVGEVQDPVVKTECSWSSGAYWDWSQEQTLTLRPTGWFYAPPLTTIAWADRATPAPYTGPVTFSEEGTHTFSYRTYDAAGVSEDTHTVPVFIDRSAPALADDAKRVYAGDAVVRIGANDRLAGMWEIEYRVDAGATQTAQVPIPGWTGSVPDPYPRSSYATVTASSVGTHTIEFRACDAVFPPNYTAVRRIEFQVVPPAAVEFASRSVVIGYGGNTVLAGRVVADARGVPGVSVVLQQAVSRTGVWTDAASATTDSLGRFGFRAAPASARYYRVRMRAKDPYPAGVSTGVVSVVPRAKVTTPSFPSIVSRRLTYRATGSLYPAHRPHGTVRLVICKRIGGVWRRWGSMTCSTNIVGGRCAYSCAIRLGSTGTYRIQAIHADAGHAASGSGYRYVRSR